MSKFIAFFLALLVGLIFLVVFFGIYLLVALALGFDLSDESQRNFLGGLYLSSFAIVIAVITLILNILYARSKSITDRNGAVRPLVMVRRSLFHDKFYSDYRFRLTLPSAPENKVIEYITFKCVLHNYGLGIAQKLAFLAKAGGRYYKSEGVAQVLEDGGNTTISFSYFPSDYESFDLFAGFQDVYGNVYFVKLIASFSDPDRFYGNVADSVSIDENVLIAKDSVTQWFLRKAYFSDATKMIGYDH